MKYIRTRKVREYITKQLYPRLEMNCPARTVIDVILRREEGFRRVCQDKRIMATTDKQV